MAVRTPGGAHRVALASLVLGVALSAAAEDEAAFHPFRQSAEPPEAEQAAVPAAAASPAESPAAVGATGVAAQPTGALTGRIVFTSGGHGWTWTANGWVTQRGVNNQMNEDTGNLDQMTLFVAYCFNAGATVIPLRPVGYQAHEVVLDNDSPGVTFAGSWSDSTATVYYGTTGDLPYRFATAASTETAVATYTPNIPATGDYPVYCWAAHGANRVRQLYRIFHTGGETQVRIPHDRVGKGWVYLGTYRFRAGTDAAAGSVRISNRLEPGAASGVVIADAIRFGNGFGDVNRGTGVSTYPREEECSRYWVQRMVGPGQDPALYDGAGDDSSDNVGTPPRMAAEMNRSESGTAASRVYVGFHSNAGGGRGAIGLYNNESLFPGTSTSARQITLARLLAREVNDDLVALSSLLETPWHNRGDNLVYARSDYAFGEIRGDALDYEMDATIVEVAFHDSDPDARLLRDPKARTWCARAVCHGLVRYFAQYDGASLVFLPEPPADPRAGDGADGIRISWSPPPSQAGSGVPTAYRVYRSTDGYGFGSPVSTTGTSILLTDVPLDTPAFFRVTAVNAGGESLPSATVGCRRASNPAQSRVLVVNGFTRLDRTLNLRQTLTPSAYRPPGHDQNTGAADRVVPARANAFNYVVPHGEAIDAFGWPFDSCQRRHVADRTIRLDDYAVVIWASGNQSTAGRTFTASEQSAMTAFLASGGNAFVSGAEIAWDLDRDSGPGASDRAFLHQQLHARLGGDANDDAGSYTVIPAADSIFAGSANGLFDDGSRGLYWVGYPDRLTPEGAGASTALRYAGTTGAAAVVHPGTAGGGRIVYFGFPFETLTSAAIRRAYMADVLRFLSRPARLEILGLDSDGRLQVRLAGEPGLTYEIQRSVGGGPWITVARVLNASGTVDFADTVVDTTPVFYRTLLEP
ncbi:MAG TPA: hypothetical protein PKM73_20080 [Verrucomicrobiota bacterium]|nr:hypothetical protein [Verrucomicrobiota bacterium]HNU51475.1 hypothetical protein [Verrucomicrobiota bacterium]